MKNAKSYLFLLMFLVPAWNLLAATQHSPVRSHIAAHHHLLPSGGDDCQLAVDLSDDDDVLLADDDDSDDISETLIKSVPVSVFSFSLFHSSGLSFVRVAQVVPVREHLTSLSYLRVFRI